MQFLLLFRVLEELLFFALEELLFLALEELLFLELLLLLLLLLLVLVAFLLMLFLALRFSMFFCSFQLPGRGCVFNAAPFAVIFTPPCAGYAKAVLRVYPKYFEEREKALLGSRYETLYAAPGAAPARGLTVNRLRCTARQFALLADFALEPSPFCPEGFLVREPGFRPGRHPYHHAGVFYSQEPSASAPAALLEVRPGMRVLDLCAAPGGKSSQLAGALRGRGLLVSNEYEPARAEALKSNLERMGAANAVVINAQPAALAAAMPGFFDRVLVDAPCSGEGMFRKEPQALARHSPDLVAQCAALGAEILESAAALLAPGGVLVYSTCTFAPEEDEGQIGSFLAAHPEFELLDCCGAFGSPGEQNRCGAHPFDTAMVRRIWPSQGGEGHFMAKLRRAAGGAPPRPVKPPRAAKAPPEWAQFAQQYVPALAGAPVLAAGELLLLPPAEPFLAPAKGARVLRQGVALGRAQKGRFEPAHHLFMAFGGQCENKEELTLKDGRVAAWLRGEEIEAETALPGWCCVLVDGFPLGAGKVSGGRVKNHYPKALRNLG